MGVQRSHQWSTKEYGKKVDHSHQKLVLNSLSTNYTLLLHKYWSDFAYFCQQEKMKYIFIWKEVVGGGWRWRGRWRGRRRGRGQEREKNKERETEWLNFIFQWWRYNTDISALYTDRYNTDRTTTSWYTHSERQRWVEGWWWWGGGEEGSQEACHIPFCTHKWVTHQSMLFHPHWSRSQGYSHSGSHPGCCSSDRSDIPQVQCDTHQYLDTKTMNTNQSSVESDSSPWVL